MSFPFELLSDSEETACSIFRVMKMKNMYGKQVRGIERSTRVSLTFPSVPMVASRMTTPLTRACCAEGAALAQQPLQPVVAQRQSQCSGRDCASSQR